MQETRIAHGWKWDSMGDSIRAAVFGEMVKIAKPILTEYHGDLFHDAVFLSAYLTKNDIGFYWGVRESGTVISPDDIALVKRYTDKAYRVTLLCKGGTTHYVRIEEL